MGIATLVTYLLFSAFGCLGSTTGTICFVVGWGVTALLWLWYDLWNRYFNVPTLNLSPSAKRWMYWGLGALGLGLFVWRVVAGFLEVGRPYLFEGAALATPVVYAIALMLDHGWATKTSQAATDKVTT